MTKKCTQDYIKRLINVTTLYSSRSSIIIFSIVYNVRMKIKLIAKLFFSLLIYQYWKLTQKSEKRQNHTTTNLNSDQRFYTNQPKNSVYPDMIKIWMYNLCRTKSKIRSDSVILRQIIQSNIRKNFVFPLFLNMYGNYGCRGDDCTSFIIYFEIFFQFIFHKNVLKTQVKNHSIVCLHFQHCIFILHFHCMLISSYSVAQNINVCVLPWVTRLLAHLWNNIPLAI